MKYYCDGNDSGWLSEPPTRKELQRLSIPMLLVIVKARKRGLKNILINFLLNENNKA